MNGYFWAETVDGALLIVLFVNGRGFVPGREGAINLDEIFVREPVQWPEQTAAPSQNSDLPYYGARARAVTRGSNILPFGARG